MNDKYALVTGAGRGTGRAVARAFHQAGARLALIDLNPDAAQSLADELGAEAHVLDVSNKMAVQTALYALLDAWPRIDVLVNAAHVVPHSPAIKLDEWEWNRTIDVNLKSVFLVGQTVARAMRETGGGLILNVVRPAEVSAQAAVRAAREGLLGLTSVLAAEWSEFGVRVEALESGADPAQTAAEALRRCLR